MGRSRRDGALWARIAQRGGTEPSEAGADAVFLQVDPTSGALVVTGAGAAASATALRVQDGDTTRTAVVGTDRALLVRDVTQSEAKVDASNFPAAPLAAGATFTGAWVDALAYAAITVVVFTDQPSATNGAVVDFSADGVEVSRSVSASIPANVGSYFSLAPEARFYRLRYTNGATAQTVLRGQVLLRYQPPALVEQPLGSSISDVNLAQIVRSAVSGRLADGRYLPVAITADQRLLVDTELAQPLTDVELRAAPVPVATGLAQPLTDVELRAAAVPVSGPLTDAQLRASPLNVVTQVDAVTLLVLTDATYTASGSSAALSTDALTRVAVDLTVTAVSGIGAEVRFILDRQGADGRWYPVWTSAATTAPATLSTTVGQGMAVAQSLAAQVRLRWEISGTSPSFTFGGGVVGK